MFGRVYTLPYNESEWWPWLSNTLSMNNDLHFSLWLIKSYSMTSDMKYCAHGLRLWCFYCFCGTWQQMVTVYFHCMGARIVWTFSPFSVNSFCVPQKKGSHMSLDWHEVEFEIIYRKTFGHFEIIVSLA